MRNLEKRLPQQPYTSGAAGVTGSGVSPLKLLLVSVIDRELL